MKLYFSQKFIFVSLSLGLILALNVTSVFAASTIGTNLSTDGNLTVGGSTTLSGGTTIAGVTGITGNTTITGTLGVSGNFAVNTNKFAVAGATGIVTLTNGETIDNSTTNDLIIFATNTANADTIVLAPKTGGAGTFSGTITSADLTANRTWTLPNVSGTVVTTGDTGTVTGTMITDGTIDSADLASSLSLTTPTMTIPILAITATGDTFLSASQSGMVFTLTEAAGGGNIVLPAPATGLHYRFIMKNSTANDFVNIKTTADALIMNGIILDSGDGAGGGVVSRIINSALIYFNANASVTGDYIDVISDGTLWYVNAAAFANGGIETT